MLNDACYDVEQPGLVGKRRPLPKPFQVRKTLVVQLVGLTSAWALIRKHCTETPWP